MTLRACWSMLNPTSINYFARELDRVHLKAKKKLCGFKWRRTKSQELQALTFKES